MTTSADEQLRILRAGAAEIISEEELAERLARPLRVKLGIDATADYVHLGFTVPLRKLRQFQDLGHTVVLIVGDFTARIGDPSGQDKTRPMLSEEETRVHAERLVTQFGNILSADRLEVRHNSEWLEPLGVHAVLELANHQTVAQMLQRDDFANRFEAGTAITIREFMYPLLQAYDSVAVEADVEIGGTDQTFNFIVARHVQRAYGLQPQVVLTLPLIEGTDGVRKMSKSLGNFIGITEEPNEIYGKLMRVPDELMEKYFRLTTDLPADEITSLLASPPQLAKRALAHAIVRMYHGDTAAEEANEHFDRVFVEHKAPEDMPSVEVTTDPVFLPAFLTEIGAASSNSDARRKIEQGGVHLGDDVVTSQEMAAADLRGRVLRVGKIRHYRLT